MTKSLRPTHPFCFFVFFVLILGAGCSQKSRVAAHLNKAETSFSAGNYEAAEIEYLNVLKLVPEDPASINRLGVIYYEQGRIGRALPFLLKGKELRPEDVDLRAKLATAFAMGGRITEARNEASQILGKNPVQPEALMVLVETAQRATEGAEVRQRLLAIPESNRSAMVHAALALLDMRERKFKEAQAGFERALAQDPKSSIAYSGLGHLHWAQKDLAAAEKEFTAGAKLARPRSALRLQAAIFHLRMGNRAAAKTALEEVTKATPDYLPAWIFLAENALNDGKLDDASAAIAKVFARDSVHPEALVLRARIKQAKNQNAEAVAEFESLAKSFPQSAQIHYFLGMALLGSGDANRAAASFKQALALAPGFVDATVALAGINIVKGDFRPAVLALQPVVEQRPDVSRAQLLLADAYRSAGNLDEALVLYKQLQKAAPNNAQVLLMSGVVFARQDKPAEARQAFQKALDLAPELIAAVDQLIALDIAQKDFPAAIARANVYIEKFPKVSGPRLLLAKIYLAQQNNAEAEKAILKAIEVEPQATTAYGILVRLHVATGKLPEALKRLNELLAINPKDIGGLMLTGMIYQQQNNFAGARAAYEKVIAVDPRFFAALNNLADLCAEHFGELDKALDFAQRSRNLQPHDPHVADTLGWILYRKGQYSRAIGLLQESAGKLPDSAAVQFHLGMVSYMMGDESRAKSALERALQLDAAFGGAAEAKQRLAVLSSNSSTGKAEFRRIMEQSVAANSNDVIALLRLAASYEEEGNVAKAIEFSERARSSNPTSTKALIQLARLYTDRNDTAKALEVARSARKLDVDDPVVARQLGSLALVAGDFAWAESLLQESARQQPDDPEILFDLAKATYALGRSKDGRALLAPILSGRMPYLKAAEVRRFLALLTFIEGGAKVVAGAPALNTLVQEEPSALVARMALARADEARGQLADAKQAYQKLLVNFPDFIPAKGRLAVLYAREATPPENSAEFAAKARDANPDDMEVAKASGILSYRSGDFTRAITILQQVAKQLPADAEVHFYVGAAQFKSNRGAEAKSSLERSIELKLSADLALQAREMMREIK